jgi:ABC-2 type transport system permease protein
MNAALFAKTLRYHRFFIVGGSLLLILFVIVFLYAVSSLPMENAEVWMNIPWIKSLISSLMGSDISGLFDPSGMATFVFTHPVVLAIVIALVFSIASASLVGEIDRGTIDLLASLPISRSSIYASVSIALVGCGPLFCAALWIGALIGRSLTGQNEIRLDALGLVAVQFFFVYVFLCGMALGVSAMCSRRYVALAICFGVVLYAFTVNVLSAFWPALKIISYSSFFRYYAPLRIVEAHAVQWGSVIVLTVAGLALWLAGLLVFRSRDFPST